MYQVFENWPFPPSLNCKARSKRKDYTKEFFFDRIKSNSNKDLVIPTDTSSFDVELLRMDISNEEVHDQNVSYCPVADLSFDQLMILKKTMVTLNQVEEYVHLRT